MITAVSRVVSSSRNLGEPQFYSYFTPTLSLTLSPHLPLNSFSLWELKDSYIYSYFTPDYIFFPPNLLIYKHIQKCVRVSFSAPGQSPFRWLSFFVPSPAECLVLK